MIHSQDFTSQLTDKHFTNITFRQQVSLINRFHTGGPVACRLGNKTGRIALKSCYKTAASEGKSRVCPNRNTISPEAIPARKSQYGEAGWPDVFRQVHPLFVRPWFLPLLCPS